MKKALKKLCEPLPPQLLIADVNHEATPPGPLYLLTLEIEGVSRSKLAFQSPRFHCRHM